MLNIQVDYVEISKYLAIILRLSLVLFLIPPFSNPRIPATVKVCFVVGLTTMLFPLLAREMPPLVFHPATLLGVVVGETIFGMLMAVCMYVILGGFELAGELISYETGLSMAQVVDPQSGTQMPILSNLIELMALLLFFTVNGHHVILRLIVESFRTIPIGGFVLNVSTLKSFLLFSGQLFIIAIKLAAPVVIVLFLIQVGMGVISKFVPNINILITSFPVTIIVALVFMGLAVSMWSEAMPGYFHQVLEIMQDVQQIPFPGAL